MPKPRVMSHALPRSARKIGAERNFLVGVGGVSYRMARQTVATAQRTRLLLEGVGRIASTRSSGTTSGFVYQGSGWLVVLAWSCIRPTQTRGGPSYTGELNIACSMLAIERETKRIKGRVRLYRSAFTVAATRHAGRHVGTRGCTVRLCQIIGGMLPATALGLGLVQTIHTQYTMYMYLLPSWLSWSS